MPKQKLITLNDYIIEKGMTAQDFSNMTGISYSRLASIKNVTNPIVDLATIIKVYETTKKQYGKGLRCQEWLSITPFWE